MPTQLNKTASGRHASVRSRPETPMFTKEWSIPAILTVFLLGVCGLIAYFTWTRMPPATPPKDHGNARFTLSDSNGHAIAEPASKKQP